MIFSQIYLEFVKSITMFVIPIMIFAKYVYHEFPITIMISQPPFFSLFVFYVMTFYVITKIIIKMFVNNESFIFLYAPFFLSIIYVYFNRTCNWILLLRLFILSVHRTVCYQNPMSSQCLMFT